MTVVVGYFEDFTPASVRGQEVYADGPFVVTRSGSWRVEVMGPKSPVYPDASIYALVGELYVSEFSRAIQIRDFLNKQVSLGKIIRQGDRWVAGV